jgi:hypothetical protein
VKFILTQKCIKNYRRWGVAEGSGFNPQHYQKVVERGEGKGEEKKKFSLKLNSE